MQRLAGHDLAIITNALRQKARDDREAAEKLGRTPQFPDRTRNALLSGARRAAQLADVIELCDALTLEDI